MVTYNDVNAAYKALRVIGAPENNYFDGHVRAKTASLRLQKALKVPYEAATDTEGDIAKKHTVQTPEGPQIKNVVEYRKEQREMLAKEVENIDPSAYVLKASMIGLDILKKIPDNVLADLGPFFDWDLEDDSTNDEGTKNRAERRA